MSSPSKCLSWLTLPHTPLEVPDPESLVANNTDHLRLSDITS